MVKCNSRLEFPDVLDMYPYTKEGLFEEDMKSKLKTQWNMKSQDENDSDGKEEDGKDDEKEEDPITTAPKQPDWYYKYRLRGVVVHTGSANGGHYYSFIKRGTGKEAK